MQFNRVEVNRFGQYGFTDVQGTRSALVFSDLGDVSGTRLSFVKNSAFHDGDNGGIAVYGSDNMLLEGNVFFNAADFGKWEFVKLNLIVWFHSSFLELQVVCENIKLKG